MIYMKKLREDGDGEFEFIQLDPSQYTAEQLLHDSFEAKGWADATEDEYTSQVDAANS